MATIFFSLYLSQCDYMASPIKSGAYFSPTLKPSWPCEECSGSTSKQFWVWASRGPTCFHLHPWKFAHPLCEQAWPGLQGMKDHMEQGRATQLSHLDQSAPNQPSHWPQLCTWAQPLLEGSPSPAQIVEPQNGEWINRCFKPTWFFMQQKTNWNRGYMSIGNCSCNNGTFLCSVIENKYVYLNLKNQATQYSRLFRNMETKTINRF